MELYFLDVGQGTCQIILLGDRKAIVIDCGAKRDRTALKFLLRYGVQYITRLIVSHSHDDHMGAAPAILGEYQDRIETIAFVKDHQFLRSDFWTRISQLLTEKVLKKKQLIRLERSNRPQLLWSKPESRAKLMTYSPTAAENLAADDAEKPNQTSAVLFFDVGENRVIFAADSQVEQWEEMQGKRSSPFPCKVLAVSHHGGTTHETADSSRLYGTIVMPEVAVVSVGTSNSHGHPRKEVIDALRASGATVICTQITKQCSGDLESVRPGVLRPIDLIGRSSPTAESTPSGKSRNVACAGTVLAKLTPESVIVERLEAHQTGVQSLSNTNSGCPMCR